MKLTVFLDVSNGARHDRQVTPAEINDSPLIRLGSPVNESPAVRNPRNSPMETPISSGWEPQDASSCETVLRRAQQTSSQSPSWAQELYENGIVFAHPARKVQRGDQDGMSRGRSPQPWRTPEPQERHITFASPPVVPANRVTTLERPVRPLPSIYSNAPGFHRARPPPDPREERCRKAKTSLSGTQEEHKEVQEVLRDDQCREMKSWTRKRTLASATPEGCPTTKTSLIDQNTPLRQIAPVKKRNFPQDGTLAGALSPNQTLEHVAEGNWSIARNTIDIERGPEIIRRSGTVEMQSPTSMITPVEKNSITHIPNLSAVGLKRDRLQRSSEPFATPPVLRKEDPLAVGLSQEREIQKNTQREQLAMEWKVEEDHETRHRGAGEETSSGGSAYTRTTTTTGSDHRVQMDDTSRTSRVVRCGRGHVPGTFNEQHQEIPMSNGENSHAPLIPSFSWSAQTPLVDIQGHDTTWIQTPEMVDMGKQPEEGDHTLTNEERLPTFMTMFPRQSSTATTERTTDGDVWPADSNDQMRESTQETLWKRGRPEGEEGERRAPITESPREWVALVVGGAMVLSVHAVRLYLRYLRYCLDPQSGLMRKMHEGRLTIMESGAVVLTVLVTFHVAFGVYKILERLGAAVEWFRVMCEE